MKITLVLLTLVLVEVSAGSLYSQETKLDLSVENQSFRKIIREIRKQSEFNFVYESEIFEKMPVMSINIRQATVEEVLDRLIGSYDLEYEIEDRTIVIRKAKPPVKVKREVTGQVKEKETGTPIVGASVLIKGTTMGTTTDTEGRFRLDVEDGAVLVISYLGFKTIEVPANGNLQIALEEDVSTLESLVFVGSRGEPRSVIESPVPIDNIDATSMGQSGQLNLEQIINYRIPSFNASNQTISDATAHFDPSELRNLGPSRTLVLINGKRKSQSALVYVNDTPGKGEVGTDLKSIPTASIERVEVLRDGAAAQYGSDAIAGVINIVLKERVTGEASLSAGVTTEGDGATYDASVSKGFRLNENGFINFTTNFYHQDYTNRAGEPGSDALFGQDGSDPFIQQNPDLGMTVGQPEYDKVSFYTNFGQKYAGDAGEIYAFGGYTYRDGKSFALYRTPYWITDDAGLLTSQGGTYNGFQPTFETEINDWTFTVGNKYKFGNWNTDISITSGSNDAEYTIGNTINVSLLPANNNDPQFSSIPTSPTSFNAGAYRFGTTLGNIDISRSFGDVDFYFGSEIRREVFEVTAGQLESYINADTTGNSSPGAQSFPGLQPGNALEETRNNVGLYTGFDWEATESFLIGGAIRYENYSDFGNNVSWKVNARQLFADGNGAFRTSISTGFRAPSLHQIYLSNVQTLVSSGTVSNQGTFNNVSPVIRALGVPELDAETSFNFSAGITYKISNNLSITADYYNISIDDRVLFTGEIGEDGDNSTINPVEQILIDNDVTSIKFFVNALDTRTQGADIILDYTGIQLGARRTLSITSSTNFNETTIRGSIDAPGVIGEQGYDIFNRKEQSRVTTARPNFKTLLGVNLDLGWLNVSLNNTYFGEVTWNHADDPTRDQTFGGKVLTDLLVTYDITEKFAVNFTANNLFDVYPDEIDNKGDIVTDLGGRFRYPWEVNQFGFNGTILKLGANYRF